MTLTTEQKLHLKSQGIIPQKQEGFVALRFLSHAGYFSSEEMIALSHLATQYGNGSLGLTSRLTIEIPYITYENIDAALNAAKLSNLRIGGGGATVRAIMTCKGTVCSHGLMDTNKWALTLEEAFFGMPLPGKFKIAVLGCINSYGKAQSNDLSIMPIKRVALNLNQCIHCNKCVKVCQDQAFASQNNTLTLDHSKCTSCMDCIPICPAHALESTDEVDYLILIGGRMGRKARLATPLPIHFKEEDLIPMVAKILNYYHTHALPKERFAELIERIGLEVVEKSLCE